MSPKYCQGIESLTGSIIKNSPLAQDGMEIKRNMRLLENGHPSTLFCDMMTLVCVLAVCGVYVDP